MILALLVAAAAPQTAVEAEREFAARAQTEGMWTAFRATAADDAVMFVPQPVKAQEWLKDRKDPLLSYMWWPAEAYMSCDGQVAVTTGPAVRGAYRGYFTTVWERQPDGRWKWILDHGDAVAKPRPVPERPTIRRASCAGRLTPPVVVQPTNPPEWPKTGVGYSPDGTLGWSWSAEKDGARTVTARLRNGTGYKTVLSDSVSAAE